MDFIKITERDLEYVDLVGFFPELKTEGLSDDGAAVMAMDEDLCVGAAYMRLVDGIAYLENIYVLPEYRFQKWGSMLAETLVSECISKGIPALHFAEARVAPREAGAYKELLLDMERIRVFFDQCGFLTVVEEEQEEKADCIVVSGVRVIAEEAE